MGGADGWAESVIAEVELEVFWVELEGGGSFIFPQLVLVWRWTSGV